MIMGRGISPGPSARASLRRVVVMGAIAITIPLDP